MASEFDLIKTYFSPLSNQLAADEIGIGDDGAVLNAPLNHQLVVVTDTLVCGVHFPEDATPYDIAWKSLAVNLSDLAAMGAKPGFFSLALTLPHNDSDWLQGFSEGLAAIAKQYSIPLIGGDTTKGPLTVSVTAQGWVEQEQAILRKTAKAKQQVWVTNTLGDAALGLKLALKQMPQELQNLFSEDEKAFLLKVLNRPQPQLEALALLKAYAKSAIDISDGFIADLTHILQQSSSQLELGNKLLADIELNNLPVSTAMQKYLQATDDWSGVLAGGDDYQVCFTAEQQDHDAILELAQKLGVSVSLCGEISLQQVDSATEESFIGLTKSGSAYQTNRKGYLHF